MDASAEETVATDSLGRRTGPRRAHSLEEKLQIVNETHVVGASVSTVARHHNVNPNQVFAWRQLYRQGLLKPGAEVGTSPLLPVKVSTLAMHRLFHDFSDGCSTLIFLYCFSAQTSLGAKRRLFIR